MCISSLYTVFFATLVVFSAPCLAGPGHGHGHTKASTKTNEATPPKQVLFKNVNVIDGKSKSLKKANVLKENNLIADKHFKRTFLAPRRHSISSWGQRAGRGLRAAGRC